MHRFRFWLALWAVSSLVILAARSEEQRTAPKPGTSSTPPLPVAAPAVTRDLPFPVAPATKPVADNQGVACTIYSLNELGPDPEFGKWIATVIPQVIEPGSWNQEGHPRRMLSYYAPEKVLVVCHTPAVQNQVVGFLKCLKKALPAVSGPGTTVPVQSQGVVPARYSAGTPTPSSEPGAPYPYPVPLARQQPKHLFHFIIRYEGDGVIDSNVVKMIQAQAGEKTAVHVPPPQASSYSLPPGVSPLPTPAGPPAPAPSFPPENKNAPY